MFIMIARNGKSWFVGGVSRDSNLIFKCNVIIFVSFIKGDLNFINKDNNDL